MALARRHYNVGIDSKSSFSVCLLRSSGQGKFLLCKWCMDISSLLKHSLQERKAHSGGKQKITNPKRKKLGSFWDDSPWLAKRHKPTLVWENSRAGDWEEVMGLWVAGKPAEAPAHSFPVLCPAFQTHHIPTRVWVFCLHVFPRTTCMPGVYGGQKRASGALSWSYRGWKLVQELGIEPKSPREAATALDFWDISSVPQN